MVDFKNVLVINFGIIANAQTAGVEISISPLIILITNRDHLSAILVEIDLGVSSPNVTTIIVEIAVAIITLVTLPLPTKFMIKVPTNVAISTLSRLPNSSNVPKNFSFSSRVFSIASAFLLP